MEQTLQPKNHDIQASGKASLGSADLAICLALLFATLGLYHQVSHFAYLRVDDPQYVAQNWHVLSGLNFAGIRYAMTAIVSSNWHPVTLLVEMLVVQLFGSSPAVLHNLCAGLHSANVVLLFIFLRSTTGSRFKAMIVAMLWGWHPLRVESVAWVGELKDVLCGFFWLLAMLAFANYRRRPSVGSYLPVLFATAMALLSKPMAVTLPAALFLLNFWPLRQVGQTIDLRWISKRLLEQLPLLILSLAVGFVSLRTQQVTNATGTLEDFPISLRVTNALYSYLCYVGKQFVPIHMGHFYPHPAMLNKTVPLVQWICGAVLIALVSAVTWRVRLAKPYLWVNWVWFIGCLVPVIGLIQVGQASRADRYTYLPSVGLTVMVVWGLADLLGRLSAPRLISALLPAAAVAALFAVTVRQISFWENNVTLMSHSNAVIPDNYLAQSSLALSAASEGRVAEAIAFGQSAVALVPWNHEAHHALAMAYAADNRIPDAIREDAIAIHKDASHPGLWIDLGHLLLKQDRLADAIKAFRKALELDPDLPATRHDLAATLARTGDLDDAIAQWQIVIQQSPGFGFAHGLLADALRLRGDRTGAIEQYQLALACGESNPDWKANLAWQLAVDPSSSVESLKQVVNTAREACDQTQNKLAFPCYAYSLTLARLSRFDDAIEAGTTALRLAESSGQPQMATAIRNRLEAYRRGLFTNPESKSATTSTAPTSVPSTTTSHNVR